MALKGVGGGGVAFDGTVTATSLRAPDGAANAPGYGFTSESSGTGLYVSGPGVMNVVVSGSRSIAFAGSLTGTVNPLGWYSAGFASFDTTMNRVAANSIQFGGTGVAAGAATGRTELNKAVASIANAVATDVLAVTIPNAAHSASLKVRVTGSLGAGGAIGANEATATNEYTIAITRTAGVNVAIAISSASGAAASAVAGAATVTCTAALSAVSGAVGATNTFTVQATISRSAGSSTNHTCFVYAQLCNANATGVTIA